MIPLIETKERSFGSLTDLRDFLAGQDRRDYELPVCQISLNEDGILRAGKLEAPLAQSGAKGVLNLFGIPWQYGAERCPRDLLVYSVQRLAQDIKERARLQVVDGVITAVMSADRLPIKHEVLVDWLGDNKPVEEAVVSESELRITALTREPHEVLPGDAFGCGWELINSEDGWLPTEAWRYVVRQVCSNGQLGFDRTASFRRSPRSQKPVFDWLETLSGVLENVAEVNGLDKAIKWAAETMLAREHEGVVDYLAQRLQGDATRLSLNHVSSETSWYKLLNTITTSARLHRLHMRRRYEFQGGVLLRWFLSEGRRRPPWHSMQCDVCEYWAAD